MNDVIWCVQCRNFINFDMSGFGECGVIGDDCCYCDLADQCPNFLKILSLSGYFDSKEA